MQVYLSLSRYPLVNNALKSLLLLFIDMFG